MTEDFVIPVDVQNIILIGFMAAGKSSVGRILARELCWNYLDTDKEIEHVTGLKIYELFRKYGEVRFRSEENLIVKKLDGVSRTVIATGGGTVMNHDNLERLKKVGTLVHLYVPLELALKRAKKRLERPLLTKNEAEIEQLWRERLTIYNKAHISINTTDKDLTMIVAEILQQLKGGHLDNASEN